MRARHRMALGDWRLWVYLTAFVLSLACLVRPSWRGPAEVFDYVFVFDITQSMNVRDMGQGRKGPTRLGYARQAAARVLEGLPCGSAVGVAIFSAHRSLLLYEPVEVCTHYSEITRSLAGLDWRMAWRARSEVAKGLYSAIEIVQALGGSTRLAFFTDGHEAPPINSRFRPRPPAGDGGAGGLMVGVGGRVPVPIPKLDRGGRHLGYWRADEVMQTDVYSYGRPAGEGREPMVDVGPAPVGQQGRPVAQEHLSALHEDYLRQLAAEQGMNYLRLGDPAGLARQLTRPGLGRQVIMDRDLRPVLGGFALLLLLMGAVELPWSTAAAWLHRHRGVRAAAGEYRVGRSK